jgi:hypothetical protein
VKKQDRVSKAVRRMFRRPTVTVDLGEDGIAQLDECVATMRKLHQGYAVVTRSQIVREAITMLHLDFAAKLERRKADEEKARKIRNGDFSGLFGMPADPQK